MIPSDIRKIRTARYAEVEGLFRRLEEIIVETKIPPGELIEGKKGINVVQRARTYVRLALTSRVK